MNWLSTSDKGWRFRRPGEIILQGDLQPAGVVWEPVHAHLIGTEVMGARWSGGDEPELIITPRKRRLSEAQRQKELRIFRTGNGLPT